MLTQIQSLRIGIEAFTSKNKPTDNVADAPNGHIGLPTMMPAGTTDVASLPNETSFNSIAQKIYDEQHLRGGGKMSSLSVNTARHEKDKAKLTKRFFDSLLDNDALKHLADMVPDPDSPLSL